MSYFDIGAVVIIFVIFVIAHVYLTVHPFKLLEKLFSEFKDLGAGKLRATGAINALGLVVVAGVGILILIETVFASLLALALKFFQPQHHTHEYAASVTPLTLLIALVMLAVLSTLLTLFAEAANKPGP
jgi:hypothetical protein